MEDAATEAVVARVGPAAHRLVLLEVAVDALEPQCARRRVEERARVAREVLAQVAHCAVHVAQALVALEVDAAALAQVVHARHSHHQRLQLPGDAREAHLHRIMSIIIDVTLLTA